MRRLESQNRSSRARRALLLLQACGILAPAASAHAEQAFLYGGKPIHPGCVQAIAMHQGDAVPVTTAVSLEGCASSVRTRAEVRYEAGDLAVIEDEALLGGGSFGYRVLSRLDNGIFGLAIRRVLPDGSERVSLAAVEIVRRPMILRGSIVQFEQMELLGELWVPDMELTSFRSAGNRVHFVSGVGPDRVERDVDFTRLGKMRN
jgi:hypothetical protein